MIFCDYDLQIGWKIYMQIRPIMLLLKKYLFSQLDSVKEIIDKRYIKKLNRNKVNLDDTKCKYAL